VMLLGIKPSPISYKHNHGSIDLCNHGLVPFLPLLGRTRQKLNLKSLNSLSFLCPNNPKDLERFFQYFFLF
jgi:hypothetical protein